MTQSASTTQSPNQERATARQIARSPKALWQLTRDSFSAWIDDFAPSMGAAISYYTVFSIAPLLLIVIAIAGFVLGEEAASGQVFAQVQGLVGDEGATAIQGMVESTSDPGKSTIGAIVGFITLLLGATTVFGELQSALDRIWKAPAAAEKEGLWKLVRTRILSFGMILGIGFLLLVSLVVSAALAALGSWWAPLFGAWETLLQVVNFIVSFAVVTALFAMIYKWLPRAEIGWHDVWIGAAATALLFTIGKFLIGLYIGKSTIVSGFGAAGSLAVILVWVYYSAQIFLLGAEFTWIYAYRYGSRRGQEMPKMESQTAAGVPGRHEDEREAAPTSDAANTEPGGRANGEPPGHVKGEHSGSPGTPDRIPLGGPEAIALPRILPSDRTGVGPMSNMLTRHKPAFGLALAFGALAALAALVRYRPR